MSVLINVLALLVTIAVLVGIHEYGHYAVARFYNVRVLRFSIGFGKILWRWVSPKTGTEWALSAIPLGGYVKMLDARESKREIAADEQDEEFTGKPLYQRALIVVAGPAVNLLAAVVLFAVIFFMGENGTRPILDAPTAQSIAAEAGLRQGDEIMRVQGEAVQTWKDFVIRLIGEGARGESLHLLVHGADDVTRDVFLPIDAAFLHTENPLRHLGISGLSPVSVPIIEQVVAESPAAAVALQSGDLVVALNNTPVRRWSEVQSFLREQPGAQVAMTVRRDGQLHTVHPVLEERDGRGLLGVTVRVDQELAERLHVTVRHSFWDSIVRGAARTWEYAGTTLLLLAKMVTGEATTKHLSGPVGIAEYAGTSAASGLIAFLAFLGLLSVSLGVLNLLPVPTLDGGHLVYYLVEFVSRRPVPARVEAIGQFIGIGALVFLMTLAIGNDLTRLYF